MRTYAIFVKDSENRVVGVMLAFSHTDSINIVESCVAADEQKVFTYQTMVVDTRDDTIEMIRSEQE